MEDHRGLREEDVAQIVHDLKDPLATIALEAYLLDHQLANGDPSEVRGMAVRIIRNVEFLDRLIQNLLDACSAAEGRFELHRTPTELRALLEQVIERVVPTRDRRRVVLEAPCAVRISLDELRIQRVIANLIMNALKYTPSCSGVVVRLAALADVVQVSVTDAGPGILPEELEIIFDKHQRGVAGRAFDGHGLGLYVSREIVEAHGGRIGVESIHGTASRFYFELPARSD